MISKCGVCVDAPHVGNSVGPQENSSQLLMSGVVYAMTSGYCGYDFLEVCGSVRKGIQNMPPIIQIYVGIGGQAEAAISIQN